MLFCLLYINRCNIGHVQRLFKYCSFVFQLQLHSEIRTEQSKPYSRYFLPKQTLVSHTSYKTLHSLKKKKNFFFGSWDFFLIFWFGIGSVCFGSASVFRRRRQCWKPPDLGPLFSLSINAFAFKLGTLTHYHEGTGQAKLDNSGVHFDRIMCPFYT